jgi:hypothetical protein
VGHPPGPEEGRREGQVIRRALELVATIVLLGALLAVLAILSTLTTPFTRSRR